MVIPFRWKPEHQVGLLVLTVAGGVAGIGVGHAVCKMNLQAFHGLTFWMSDSQSDVIAWAIIGAGVAGAFAYVRGLGKSN